jgi:hypothetical protein
MAGSFVAVTPAPGPSVVYGVAAIGNKVFLASSTGLLVSPDAGATWQTVSPAPGATSIVAGLALDPTSPGTVWVSAVPAQGFPWIYRSTDGGATFAAVAEGSVLGPVVVAPSNGHVVYAETQRTTDGGTTWVGFGLFD